MFAAIVAARRGLRVTVFEPNAQLGRKLRITGKGRCNVTNDCTVADVIANVPTGGKFLMSALHAFPPSAAISFFEDLGVPLKTERGGRVFPVSDNANDVADALVREMRRLGVEILRGRVSAVNAADGSVTSVTADGDTLPCRAVIVATGGVSYPATGSTGAGYAIARAHGHTVAEPRASLVPLVSPDAFCGEMMGLSLRNVAMNVYDGEKKPIFQDFGELLFTHFGLSGPLALSASAHMRDFGKREYRVALDLKPALDETTLDARLVRDLRENANRDFINALDNLLPRLMIPVIVARSGIDPHTKAHSVTREERRRLLEMLKSFDVAVSGTRPVAEAIITSGGVSTRELVPATMESKLTRNLHFAGEVLDCDAYTGGYNLQIAWSTAYAAATMAVDS
jgi:predicted Rossmann fold flavoprotein